jgi:hypothetical protein
MIAKNENGYHRSQSTGRNRQAWPNVSPNRPRCATGSAAKTKRNSCALQAGGAL